MPLARSRYHCRHATPVRLGPWMGDGDTVTIELASVGDEIPDGTRRIEVRVAELRSLFNSIDPSPFRERDLDPRAEAFIVEWSRDLPVDVPLGLVVHLERGPVAADDVHVLRDAVHEFFQQRASGARRSLRELFRRGRSSLGIGLAALAASVAIGDLVSLYVPREGYGTLLSESVLIGGWVAMWRPLEIFLYDWWPIRAEARLFDRLSVMPVRVIRAVDASPGSKRSD
jgi:hypothetical protein